MRRGKKNRPAASATPSSPAHLDKISSRIDARFDNPVAPPAVDKSRIVGIG